MNLRLSAEAFPLEAVPYISELPLDLRGRINGKVDLTGTPKDPRLQGTVGLADARVRGRHMGSGEITLTKGSDTVRLQGTLLNKLLTLDGYFLTQPRPRLHLTVDVKRFPLEKVLHEVRTLGDVHGLVTGTLRLDADAESGLTWANAKVGKLEVSLRHRNPGDLEHTTVKLSNTQDLLADYNGERLDIVTTGVETRVVGKAGKAARFTVGGNVVPSGVDLLVRGTVPLAILEFFLKGKVQRLGGQVLADVKLRGPIAQPALSGALKLDKLQVAMPGFSGLIEVPSGEVRLEPGKLSVNNLRFRLGKDELVARGEAVLDGYRPRTATLGLDGDLNLQLAELLFPRQISRASGSAAIKIQTSGRVEDPRFSGSLTIKQLELVPRGLRRTLALSQGKVSFDNYVVRIDEALEGTYDEGMVQLSGDIRLDQFDMVDIDLRIVGSGIPERKPKVYAVEANMDVRLLGDSRQLELQGDVELVDARYMRKFDVFKRALIKPKVFEAETPFYKGFPVLEQLVLKLNVRSTGQIQVKNNIADLNLSGDFAVLGTLSDPRLDGLVRAEEGTFKLPGLRGEFSLNRGEILFAKRAPLSRAQVSLTSETVFEGRNQIDYQIRLTVEGPLESPGIVLSSNPTLDQGQIWALLAFGRTTDQLRNQFGGGADAGRGSQGQAAGAADAQVKQLTGEILSTIVEDPLKKVTRLDVISLEVGTESAQIRAGKKLGRYVNVAGEYELGLLGDSRVEGRLEVKMHDLLKLVGKWERLSTRLEAEDEDPSRGKLELKLEWPLR